MGLLSRHCSGKGPHLVMRGEPRGFSRVAAGFSSYDVEHREPLVVPQGSPISIQVVRATWELLMSHCRANRPHLGMCPQIPCSFPMATGISWCIQGSPGESGPARVEGNNSALLSSCNAYHLEQTEWPKGSQASCGVLREDSGLLSRPCRKRGPHLEMTGKSRGFCFELQWDVWGFSRVTMRNTGSLLCGPREFQSPFEW